MKDHLLRFALREQRPDTLEAATLEDIPQDLQAFAVDCRPEKEFRLAAFAKLDRIDRDYFLYGRPVEVDVVETLATGGGWWCLKDGRQVRGMLVVEHSVPWWAAVGVGNLITLQAVAREHGFLEAVNTSSSVCYLRPAKPGE